MADKYSSYDDLLEQTGKTHLTPSEYRILKNRERSGGIEDTLMGSGKAYAGMLRDLYKSNIEGDEKYDRDWNWSDAVDPAMDALSVFGLRPLGAALKSKFAAGAAKGAGKGLQKGYNAATGAKRGAASKAAGGKKTLDAPDGKVPDAKPGVVQKAGTAIKNNPIKSTIAGTAGLGGAAAGINAILPDAPKGLDPLEKSTEEEIVDPGANQNLDNPNGQMAMTPEGQRIKNINDAAQSLPANVPLGTGGATKANRARMNMQAEADRQMGDFIKQQKKQSDQNNFLRDRYDATGGRRAGAWDRLSEAQKDEMVSNYRKNSFYDSNPDAIGGTAVSDIARAELGMPSMEEQRLADLDAAVERQKMSQMGYGVAADPENYKGAIPSMTKEEFSKKSGMQNEGTGIVNTTLDGEGPVTTLEMGGQFDKAGGLETAKPFLSDAQQVNLERQLDRPGVFNDQFGQEQDMSKDTVRMTSDEQDYSDANFQNRDDALAYLNRGASLDEPAPEASAPEAPEEGEDGWGWSDVAKGAGLIGGGLLLSRTKPGRKMIQKGFDMFGKKSYPPGRNKILQDAAKRNASAGTSNVSGGLGRPGSIQQMGYQGGTPQSVGRVVKVNPWSTARNAKPTSQPQANPWSSTGNMRPPAPTPQSVGRSASPAPQANPWASTGNMKPNYSGGTPQSVGGQASTQNLSNPWASTGNMRPRAATPQDAGFNARVDAMNRQDLVRGVGSPRTADGRRVATTEELRRLYRAMNQQIF